MPIDTKILRGIAKYSYTKADQDFVVEAANEIERLQSIRLETIRELYEKIRIDLNIAQERMEYEQKKEEPKSYYVLGYFEGRYEATRNIRDIVGAMLDHELEMAQI